MKKQLRLQYILFAALLATQLVFCYFGGGTWVKVSLGISVVIASVMLYFTWLKTLRKVTTIFGRILHGEQVERPALSLETLDILARQGDLLEKRIHASSEHILNLTQPEKLGTIDESDPIGKALVRIRGEMELIRREDEMRNWISGGLALFSQVLGRRSEISEYGDSIISELVKYLRANQGGFYLVNTTEGGERCMDLVACYAYSRKRHEEKRIMEGQGLLGQCMLEQDIVFMKEVPSNYVKITSGLGEATPRSIVILPLIFNDTFLGAIELASFHVMQKHELEFLTKVCENISSQIATLRNMEKTKALLDESNILAGELQEREDEMRRNYVELQSTQEAMKKKQVELTGIINAIDSTLATAEFDSKGCMIRHNNILASFFRASAQRLQDRNYTLITGAADIRWSDILDGTIRSGDFRTATFTGTDLWLSVTFTTVQDLDGRVSSVLCMIQDVTGKKIREQEFERLSLVANNTDNSVIITDANGLIEYVNSGFTKMTGYEFREVAGKKPGKLLQGPLTDKNTIKRLAENIPKGVPVYEEILNYNKAGGYYWVSLVINPVLDSDGKISKFISIQADITDTKIEALDFHQKMDALSRSNAILELDTRGFVQDINENYLRIIGYKREEVIGKPYSVLAGKESVFAEIMEQIRQNGKNSGVHARLDGDGNEIFIRVMDYPVLSFNGELEKIIEFGVDVTNEKRLEKEAERKQAELNSYLGGINNTIASAEFDYNGGFIRANQIFMKVMGFRDEDLAGKGFIYLMGEDPSVVMMWENLRLGRFFSGEFRMKSKAGTELWLTGTFNPVTIDSEVPEKIIMFAQFTTQEKEKLSELNAFVQALKSSLPVVEFSADFNCKTANEKAMTIFGLSRLALKSKKAMDFIAPFYHKKWQCIQEEVLTKETSTLILPLAVGNNALNYEVSISVTRNADGRPLKIIMILLKEVADRVTVMAAV